MSLDAIPTDVSKPQDKQDKGGEEAELSPRELAMQEIEAQLSQQGAPEPEEAKQAEPAPSAALPEILAEDQLDKVRVRVKVDGQVVEMPLSEVAKGYQKDAVASRRLDQAAEERKALDALKKQLEERERQLAAAKAPPSSEQDDEDVEAQIKAAMSALVDGDEEKATNAIKSVFKGRREAATPTIDEEALVAKAAQRIEEKRTTEDNAKAWDEFVNSNAAFADETSKERQYGDYLFNTVYGPKVEAGELSYREALSKAAQDVTTVFHPQPQQQQPQPSARQQKEQRKAAIDNLPVAGARAVRQPETEQTTDDVLAEMRASRGQPV